MRFDLVFCEGAVTIEPHFCRQWDSEGGCYGTNETHGLSLDDACRQAAEWHQQQAGLWLNKEHHDVLQYLPATRQSGKGE